MSSLQVNKIILFNNIHTPENHIWVNNIGKRIRLRLGNLSSGPICSNCMTLGKCFHLYASVSPHVRTFNECDHANWKQILYHYSAQNPPMGFSWRKDHSFSVAFEAVDLTRHLSSDLHPYWFSLAPSIPATETSRKPCILPPFSP